MFSLLCWLGFFVGAWGVKFCEHKKLRVNGVSNKAKNTLREYFLRSSVCEDKLNCGGKLFCMKSFSRCMFFTKAKKYPSKKNMKMKHLC